MFYLLVWFVWNIFISAKKQVHENECSTPSIKKEFTLLRMLPATLYCHTMWRKFLLEPNTWGKLNENTLAPQANVSRFITFPYALKLWWHYEIIELYEYWMVVQLWNFNIGLIFALQEMWIVQLQTPLSKWKLWFWTFSECTSHTFLDWRRTHRLCLNSIYEPY